jgi:hypothetical protein
MEKIDLSERHDGLLSEAIKHKIAPELKESLNKFSEAWKQWSINNDKEFRQTLKTVKNILKQKSLILPRDWKEVIWEWYVKEELSKEDLAFLEFKDVPDLLKDPKIILKWAKQYSEKIEKEVFTPDSKIHEKDESEAKEEKIHSQKTRIDLEPKYRFYLMEKLGMIDPKGIFYNTNLSLNERAKLLSKILGYNERECKDLLNRKTHFNEEKKSDLDDFLNDLIKKGKK